MELKILEVEILFTPYYRNYEIIFSFNLLVTTL